MLFSDNMIAFNVTIYFLEKNVDKQIRKKIDVMKKEF